MSEISPELRNAFLQIVTYKIALRQQNIGIADVKYLLCFSERLRGIGVTTEERTEEEESLRKRRKHVRWEETPPTIHPIKPHGKNRHYLCH